MFLCSIASKSRDNGLLQVPDVAMTQQPDVIGSNYQQQHEPPKSSASVTSSPTSSSLSSPIRQNHDDVTECLPTSRRHGGRCSPALTAGEFVDQPPAAARGVGSQMNTVGGLVY